MVINDFFSVLILGLIIWKCLQMRWRHQKREIKQVYSLVEQIIGEYTHYGLVTPYDDIDAS